MLLHSWIPKWSIILDPIIHALLPYLLNPNTQEYISKVLLKRNVVIPGSYGSKARKQIKAMSTIVPINTNDWYFPSSQCQLLPSYLDSLALSFKTMWPICTFTHHPATRTVFHHYPHPSVGLGILVCSWATPICHVWTRHWSWLWSANLQPQAEHVLSM